MTDLHSAVRTAVDARRAKADEQLAEVARLKAGESIPISVWESGFGKITETYEREALAMCDWADDVLARHARYNGMAQPDPAGEYCAHCSHLNQIGLPYPCAELISAAAAFGVETGETP